MNKAQMAIKYIIGKKFGRLGVIKNVGKDKYGNNIWFCQCDCGGIKVVSTADLNSGNVQSCGCLSRENLERLWEQRVRSPSIVAFNKTYCGYRKSAKERDLEWALDEDEFRELTQQDCFYCGVEPKQEYDKRGKGSYLYNGIDRVDNSKGYELDNCVPCCKICNYMKRIMTQQDFYSHIRKIMERIRE